VFRTVQGSGNIPTIWTFNSNVLVQSFENQVIGAHYWSETDQDVINTYHADSETARLDTAMVDDYLIYGKVFTK
jgi:hypothetical protein